MQRALRNAEGRNHETHEIHERLKDGNAPFDRKIWGQKNRQRSGKKMGAKRFNRERHENMKEGQLIER